MPSLRTLIGVCVVVCLLAGRVFALPRANSSLEALQKDRHELELRFETELQKLVIYCDERELTTASQNLRSLLNPQTDDGLHLSALPSTVQPPIPPQLSDEERYWRTQLRHHQTEYATQLYLLSRRALHAGYPSLAYDLVRDVAIHDPDHVKARELLGFVRRGDEWVTRFTAEMRKKQQVWTEDFGWLNKAHQERYRNGDRLVNGHWMSAEKEAQVRQDFRYAWEIQTEHFLIRTNHSREKALELGRALEDFHEIFYQTFAGFFNTPEQLQKLFDGSSGDVRSHKKPHEVHYYRTRDEYIRRLEPQFPQIQMTNGIYLTSDRKAHFYHDPQANNEATLFHEATHQLFYESHHRPRAIAEQANFWIIEGIACYMESFRRGTDGTSLGDPRYIRFAGARYNRLHENYYIPLREFSSLSMRDFQNHPQISKNYTQASGLAQFLMHYDHGAYREALVNHLAQLYSVNRKTLEHPRNLDELTDVPFEELDEQYEQFLREFDQSASAVRSNEARE
ncbi:MAG: DUF1570 domain-containing protein [Planctomycetaceae bacterium]